MITEAAYFKADDALSLRDQRPVRGAEVSSLDQTKKYYDENADVYDGETGFDLLGGQEYNFREYYQPFLGSAVPSSGKALELGCGTGFYTKWLADRGLDVVAMDTVHYYCITKTGEVNCSENSIIQTAESCL